MTFNKLLKLCNENKDVSVKDIIIEEEFKETGIPLKKIEQKLRYIFDVMLNETESCYGNKHKTLTGLTGDNAQKLLNYSFNFVADFVATAMIASMSMAESNAAMGKIVACPTAGSCGVVPGVFYALKKVKKIDNDTLFEGFVVCGAIGNIISKKATLAGAAGGCQAEIGSASAMASAGLTFCMTNDLKKAGNAAALCLKSIMGLVCDPIGGFVEVPCVKRNATASVLAITTSEMAIAGIESVIPFDEVVSAMYEVGKVMHENLKETAKGGIAVTETAKKLLKEFRNKQ